MRLSFIQLTAFRVNWRRLQMTAADLRALEIAILEDPSKPPVMSGTGGLRKIRYSRRHSSAGKSGGVRVCYALFAKYGLIYLCAVFPKNEKANLSDQEKKVYRQVLSEFERYLDQFFPKGWTP
jgi:hypothetical protein